MHQELIRQGAELFDNNEKWDSFIDLIHIKDDVKKYWYKKLKEKMDIHFNSIDNIVQGWKYISSEPWNYKWYLEEFGDDSFCVCMDQSKISLWAHNGLYDTIKIRNLLETSDYFDLKSVLDYYEIPSNNWNIIGEIGCFDFGPQNERLTGDKFAWFCGNKTEEVKNQISIKIDKVRRNSDITEMIRQLNNECKKK
jgi:hypothetical protein